MRFHLARVLLIEEEQDGFALYRFSKDGSFAGDTWHPTIEEAKDQAEAEYHGALGTWNHVPDDVVNADEFVIRQIL